MTIQRRAIVRIGKESPDDFEVAWMFSMRAVLGGLQSAAVPALRKPAAQESCLA
jgi:hypothetical protein